MMMDTHTDCTKVNGQVIPTTVATITNEVVMVTCIVLCTDELTR